MSYRVDLDDEAKSDIRRLPGYVRAQVLQTLHQLADNPRPARAKELRDKPTIYRIWVAGRWRIAYQVRDDLQVVRVLRVRLKEDIDYDSLETSE